MCEDCTVIEDCNSALDSGYVSGLANLAEKRNCKVNL